jgi:hypothetical protein
MMIVQNKKRVRVAARYYHLFFAPSWQSILCRSKQVRSFAPSKTPFLCAVRRGAWSSCMTKGTRY